MTSDSTEANYAVFRECVSSVIVAASTQHKPSKTPRRKARSHKSKSRKGSQKNPDSAGSSLSSREEDEGENQNPEELAEFIDFIASEIFTTLPTPLQTLTYSATQHDPTLLTRYSIPLSPPLLEDLSNHLPATVTDTLATYTSTSTSTDPNTQEWDSGAFLSRLLTDYIPSVTRPPPVWATTRTDACEICGRDWIPLSYHHLIPRGVHDKVRRKGWHDEWMLDSVAWLCRACHSFVHRMASNEELAREWFTVERILEREDVRDWAGWVGRVRWKTR